MKTNIPFALHPIICVIFSYTLNLYYKMLKTSQPYTFCILHFPIALLLVCLTHPPFLAFFALSFPCTRAFVLIFSIFLERLLAIRFYGQAWSAVPNVLLL